MGQCVGKDKKRVLFIMLAPVLHTWKAIKLSFEATTLWLKLSCMIMRLLGMRKCMTKRNVIIDNKLIKGLHFEAIKT